MKMKIVVFFVAVLFVVGVSGTSAMAVRNRDAIERYVEVPEERKERYTNSDESVRIDSDGVVEGEDDTHKMVVGTNMEWINVDNVSIDLSLVRGRITDDAEYEEVESWELGTGDENNSVEYDFENRGRFTYYIEDELAGRMVISSGRAVIDTEVEFDYEDSRDSISIRVETDDEDVSTRVRNDRNRRMFTISDDDVEDVTSIDIQSRNRTRVEIDVGERINTESNFIGMRESVVILSTDEVDYILEEEGTEYEVGSFEVLDNGTVDVDADSSVTNIEVKHNLTSLNSVRYAIGFGTEIPEKK